MDKYGNNPLNMMETKLSGVFLSNLANVTQDEMVNPIDFQGQRSMDTMDNYCMCTYFSGIHILAE